MGLLDLHDVTLAFGGPPLLDGIRLRLETGERVALVGRNGAGKSSLLRLLTGEIEPEAGEKTVAPGTKVALLDQQVPPGTHGTVTEVVADGLGDVGTLLTQHHQLSVALGESATDKGVMRQLESVQHALEAAGGWHLTTRVDTVLSRLLLPPDEDFTTLSGGLKRRVLLARALVCEPDVLLLDEPTNHLDVPAIEALEELLLGSFRGALFFVTHDRAFLRRLATRIVEIDRGQLTSWPGDYDAYLQGKEKQREVEASHNARFDKKLAKEETWIRQGIKARRTRNEGRVRALQSMRAERRERREATGNATLRIGEGARSGKRVIEAEQVCFGFDPNETPLVRDFSIQILRGDKIGILGPNGVGKTTLLKLLLGDLEPQSGTIRVGTNLEIAYFDQHRAQIDPNRTVADNIADGNDRVVIDGTPKHVLGYLQDFLFPPERARSPAGSLSGGERHRLLLARLFTHRFNLLVMDEPTNDLDAETLELLEERLLAFEGTMLLVSHDRAFLDNVVTSTIAFEGGGTVTEYVGGYTDWLRQRPRAEERPSKRAKKAKKPVPTKDKPRRLTFKEKRHLEALPATIEALETEQATLLESMADPAFFKQDGSAIAEAKARHQALDDELTTAYDTWQTLESIASANG